MPLTAPAQDSATALPEVTNTATRTERRTDEVPATVTVTPVREAQDRGVRDLKDLFKHEVDLSVRAASPRFGAALGTNGRAGNEGLNVRGLEGNQVLVVVDGIRLPQSFSFGAFATGRLDHLSLDTAHTVEVLRGPASTQFGSDGLAGALALRTLEAADLLKPGDGLGGFYRTGVLSLDDSMYVSSALAARAGAWDALVLAGTRSGSEAETQGTNAAPNSTRTVPNPLSYDQYSAMAKLGWQPTPAHRLAGTLEAVRRNLTVDVISGRTAPPVPPAPLPATAVLRLDAQDRVDRVRASLAHRFDDLDAPWLQKASTQIYAQDAKTRQISFEDRNTAVDRTRDNRYREKLVGLGTQGEGSFTAPLSQRLSGGAEWSRTKVSGVRDGTVPPIGETFPTQPFPDTNYTLFGGYVQSELQLGGLALLPALRFDRFELEPSQAGFTGGTVVALADQAFTPRLGAVWKLAEAFVPYGHWSRGFRAPTPEQVNNGFTNVAGFYRSIGNPDLKPERAESVELGLRGRGTGVLSGLSWQLAGYDNRYRDFISQEQISGSFTAADPAVFQSINLASARIRGAEARVRYEPNAAWQLRAAVASARGETERSGTTTPLNTVEPTKVSAGAIYRAAASAVGAWSVRADVLHAAAKDSSRIAQPAPPASPLFAPPSYTTLDLGFSWQPVPALTLNLSVDNALDKTYWRWSDMRGVADNSAVKDAFTAPGRTVALALRVDF